MINNQYVNQKSYKSGLHLLRHSPPDKLLMIALTCSLTFQRNAGSNAYMADAEQIPCNGLFYAMARNALHGLFLPAYISMYAYTLAVTNPDTVKRICSTLCRAALRSARNVVQALSLSLSPALCRRFLLCGLCSCRLLCACSYRGMRRTFHNVFNKKFLNKKIAAMWRLYVACL